VCLLYAAYVHVVLFGESLQLGQFVQQTTGVPVHYLGVGLSGLYFSLGKWLRGRLGCDFSCQPTRFAGPVDAVSCLVLLASCVAQALDVNGVSAVVARHSWRFSIDGLFAFLALRLSQCDLFAWSDVLVVGSGTGLTHPRRPLPPGHWRCASLGQAEHLLRLRVALMVPLQPWQTPLFRSGLSGMLSVWVVGAGGRAALGLHLEHFQVALPLWTFLLSILERPVHSLCDRVSHSEQVTPQWVLRKGPSHSPHLLHVIGWHLLHTSVLLSHVAAAASFVIPLQNRLRWNFALQRVHVRCLGKTGSWQ
jgi:hypothetical protein